MKTDFMKKRKSVFISVFLLCISLVILGCEERDLIKNAEGLVPFREEGRDTPNLYGYIDSEGNVIIKPKFYFANDFIEGLAAVSLDPKTWGYINQKGVFVIDAKYNQAYDFVDGIALVGVGEHMHDIRWFYIDKEGNQLFGKEFNFANSFNEGFAAVLIRGYIDPLPNPREAQKWSFIDTSGELATELEFDYAMQFRNGYAPVQENSLWGLIDRDFNLVVDFIHISPVLEPPAVTTVKNDRPNEGIELPDGAVAFYPLTLENSVSFQNLNSTIDWITQAVSMHGYILPGRFISSDDQQGIEYTKIIRPENTSMVRTEASNQRSTRIHPYNIDIYYYDTLTNKPKLSAIIGDDVTEDDIEFAIILDTNRFYAFFGVKTAKGDYYLEDDYGWGDDSERVHNWIVYSTEEFKRRFLRPSRPSGGELGTERGDPVVNPSWMFLPPEDVTEITIRRNVYSTSLTELDLGGMYLTSDEIEPLRYMVNLEVLKLDRNRISDISALGGLTKLTSLNLEGNQISDISVLSDLAELQELTLDRNDISDISSLRGLSNLIGLGLYYNQISDISPLNGLTNLTHLNLSMNQISSINALESLTNLWALVITQNQISDISALGGLARLRHLYLGDNQINDISTLMSLTNLSSLSLFNNPLTDAQINELKAELDNCRVWWEE